MDVAGQVLVGDVDGVQGQLLLWELAAELVVEFRVFCVHCPDHVLEHY